MSKINNSLKQKNSKYSPKLNFGSKRKPKVESQKLLEVNIRVNLCDLGLHKDFLDANTKSTSHERKT